MNDKFVQINGPFNAGEDVYAIIKEKTNNSSFSYIMQIGIQSEANHYVNINGVKFEIGKTGMLQFNETAITSLSFVQDELDSTIIDCILQS